MFLMQKSNCSSLYLLSRSLCLIVPHKTYKRVLQNILQLGPGYLAEAVDDDERGPQEVTVGRVFSHDVLVPQLDGHQSPKQLAQLLDQQVELTLDKHM